MKSHLRRRIWGLSRLTYTLAALTHLSNPAGGQALRDSVTMRISYSGLYNNSTEEARFIAFLGRILPREMVALPGGDYVEDVLLDRFRVAAGDNSKSRGRDTKGLVDSLKAEMRRLNQMIPASGKLDSGTYALMSLPPQAKWVEKDLAPASFYPEIAVGSASARPRMLGAGEKALRVVAAPPSRASSPRVLELTVARGEARQIAATLDSFKTTVNFRIISDIEYRHAVATNPDPTQAVERPLDPAVASAIRARMQTTKRQHVPLVILETGWPNPLIARVSCDRMSLILKRTRDTWKIPDPSGPVCDTTRYADPPTSEEHARQVEAAITPIEQLAPKAVDVIFVPLTRGQGADLLLREIVRIAELVDNKIDAIRDAGKKQSPLAGACRYSKENKHTWPTCGPRFPVPPDLLRHADSVADRVVALLPAEVTGNSASNRYRSSTALLQDLYQILGWNSMLDSSGAIISISWTTDAASGEIRSHLSPIENVLVVAAVGNDNKIVTSPTMQLDYGSRATGGTGVLAAVNVDELHRLSCTSSVVDTIPVKTLHREDVAAYDGGVKGACGSSFSAPRIAWFAAAAEALRPTAFNHKQWLGDLTDLFRDSRQTLTPTLRDLVLDPVLLLTAAAKGGFPIK